MQILYFVTNFPGLLDNYVELDTSVVALFNRVDFRRDRCLETFDRQDRVIDPGVDQQFRDGRGSLPAEDNIVGMVSHRICVTLHNNLHFSR